jgi:hypothetical protein
MWVVRLAGADGVFTNRPDLALAMFGRRAPQDLPTIWRRIGY